MKKPKKAVNMRLSETTIKELAELAKKHGVSQADVVAVLVHCHYVGGDMDNLDEWFEVKKLG
jgi:predicted DNA binding CopG/RHH family protein